jgi:hypothetical protein
MTSKTPMKSIAVTLFRVSVLTALAFVNLPMLGVPQTGVQDAKSIATASVGSDKQIHIVYTNGSEYTVPMEKDQVDCSSVKVADDKRTVAWLVLEKPECCTNYPIPLSLVIYRNRKVIQHITGEPMIWDWQFDKAGSQIALAVGPQHGEDAVHFELHDARTGRLLDEWDGQNKKSPAWVSGLNK